MRRDNKQGKRESFGVLITVKQLNEQRESFSGTSIQISSTGGGGGLALYKKVGWGGGGGLKIK